MKFTYLGVEYRIEFQYETKRTGKNKVRNYTFARIVTGERENQQTVAEGKVARYVYDDFNKEHARTYALDAALNVSPHGNAPAFRKAAHTAYHRRPGGLDYQRAVNKGLIESKPQAATASASLGFNIQVK